ncbi:MAG TPA: YCF48-related protein [Thermoanaerobaculia bacterium]|nr:YCF48-related protein [Thermoanaerobaculia bacterium]
MRTVLIAILLSIPFLPAAEAAWNRASLYGADVRGMVIDPKSPDRIFLGTSHGDVYVSRDGGTSWKNPRRGIPFPGYVVDNLLIDAKGRLWAACWGLWGGGVIAVSEDGGETWTRRDRGLEEFSVRAIAIDARNPELLVIGGLTGVYRSRDAGVTWQKISDQINVESLAIDPRNSDRIYVGTWRQAFRTEDGGKNWKLINNGMVLDTDVFAINIHPKNPDEIWLSTCGWVYSTVDGGDHWTRFKEGFNNRRIHTVDLDAAASLVYAGSVAGLYRSADNGKKFELMTDENLVITAVGLHPERPDRIILGTEGDGVYVSHDRGKTFTRSSKGLYNVKVTAIEADPENRGTAFAAVHFGGSASGFYGSTDGGERWERLNKDRLPEILSLVVRAGGDPRFIIGTERGFYWSEDGASWTQAEPSSFPIRVERLIVYNSQRLFAATSEGVFTSRDSGRNWYRLGGSQMKAVDLAVGRAGGRPALYALKSNGLAMFDGEKWLAIEDAPARGRTLAVRTDPEGDLIVIAGSQGVLLGNIDLQQRWREVSAPAIGFANVHQLMRSQKRSVILTSREKSELFMSEGKQTGWKSFPFPERLVEIASIAADPFDAERYFVGTSGQGIFVHDSAAGAAARQMAITAQSESAAPASLGGGSK